MRNTVIGRETRRARVRASRIPTSPTPTRPTTSRCTTRDTENLRSTFRSQKNGKHHSYILRSTFRLRSTPSCPERLASGLVHFLFSLLSTFASCLTPPPIHRITSEPLLLRVIWPKLTKVPVRGRVLKMVPLTGPFLPRVRSPATTWVMDVIPFTIWHS